MSIQEAERKWTEILSDPSRIVIVAKVNEAVVGFVHAGYNTSEDHFIRERYESQVHSVYVLPLYQHRGIGYGLMNAACIELRRRGLIGGLVLWVFEKNNDAINFYQRFNGKIIHRKSANISGVEVPGLAIAWETLDDL